MIGILLCNVWLISRVLLHDPGRTAATSPIWLLGNGPAADDVVGVAADVSGAIARLELNVDPEVGPRLLLLLTQLLLLLIMLSTFRQDTVPPTNLVTD